MVAIVLLALLLSAQPARAEISAEETGLAPYASLLYVEGDLDLATSEGADGAAADRNAPLGPGDQLTTRGGRAELLLPDGSRVWIDRDTRLDLLDLEPTPLLRLWRGAIAIELGGRSSAGAAWPRVDSPAGTIDLLEDGRYRIAASTDGFVHVTVESGLAEVGGRRSSVLVRSGQRTSVLPGDDPENAYGYNTATVDEFALFVGQRIDGTASRIEYSEEFSLPAPVALHTADLDRYGSWRYHEALATNVWSPRVAAGWRPYYDGYWASYPDGVTWVSREPFGYVTYHYGGWDYTPAFGWFWVPGDLYSPAWVDWYVYDDYVGWCPRSSYRYVDRHGRRHWRDARVVRQRIDRPFDSDRGVIVRRDGFFNGRLRDFVVSGEHVRGRRSEHRERLDGRDFRGSVRERLGRAPSAREFVSQGRDRERPGSPARDFVREQRELRTRETQAAPAATRREPARGAETRPPAGGSEARENERRTPRDFVREQRELRTRETQAAPAATRREPARGAETRQPAGGSEARENARRTPRDFVREQRELRTREAQAAPAATRRREPGTDAGEDVRRPGAREFVRESQRRSAAERAEPERRERSRNAGSDSTVPGTLWRYLRGGGQEAGAVRQSAPERRAEAPRESPTSRVAPEPRSKSRTERAERPGKGSGGRSKEKGKEHGERGRERSRK